MSSLFKQHRKRIDIPVLLVASTTLLVVGLSKPVLGVEKLFFWHDEYTIVSGIIAFYDEGQVAIATLIFFFSIIFPFAKLLGLIIVWFFDISRPIRRKTLHWLEVLGHWSMLDVFVVSIVVVIAKSNWMSDANPKPGLYVFAAAVILSMIVTFMINRLVNKN